MAWNIHHCYICIVVVVEMAKCEIASQLLICQVPHHCDRTTANVIVTHLQLNEYNAPIRIVITTNNTIIIGVI
jgi:hypothetical protein